MIQVEEAYLNQLIYLSEHDELTGVLNRYGVKKKMSEKFNPDGEGYLSVVDIDYFKTINDVCGHIVGDLVLKEFGKCLNGIRKSVVGRLGGDEFYMFIETGSYDEVMAEFKAFERRVCAIDIPQLNGMKVSFSLGAHYFKGDFEELKALAYTRADNLCYESKKLDGCSMTVEKI